MNATLDSISECIPSRITVNGGFMAVTWLQAPGDKLEEPFYYQTLEKLSKQNAIKVETDLEVLDLLAEQPEVNTPSAFIFQMSRCGSTLLTNALRSINNSMCICEAEIITQLLRPDSQIEWLQPNCAEIDISEREKLDWENKRALRLRGVINFFGKRARSTHSRFFIKFTSWSVLFIQTIKSIFPDVPCWFVYRNPLEVMVSNLERHPRWWSLRSTPEQCQSYFGWDRKTIESFSDEEFCAHCLAAFCTSVLNAIDEQTLLLRYERIDARLIHEIAARLGSRSEIDTRMLQEILTSYSKDRTGREEFVADGESKRQRASIAAQNCEKTILRTVVNRLDQLECLQLKSNQSTDTLQIK